MKYGALILLTALSFESQAKTNSGQNISTFEGMVDVELSHFVGPPKLPWGTDPFLKIPGFYFAKADTEKFILNGVFYNESGSLALINGKSVREGDYIGDRIVEEIGENFVILRKDGSEIEINLPYASIHSDQEKAVVKEHQGIEE